MDKLFGTDGIRGLANEGAMAPEKLLAIGKAVGTVAKESNPSPRVVIGKDTRLSGYMVESALMAGLVAVGANPILLGPLPTPAVSMLTISLRAHLGVMITASHNPYHDNGLKFFRADGHKLCDATEARIEAIVAEGLDRAGARTERLGQASRLETAHGRYVEAVKSTIAKGLRLDGLLIVVDCANGAAYKVAPEVLWELGAEVIAIGDAPDGTNINRDCGATDTKAMRSRVISEGADIGIALDGDGDRIIICDEKGQTIDGDQIIARIAKTWQSEGRLAGGGVAATVMSNMGLERFVSGLGLELHRTPVGDRHVVRRMRECGLNVGGEQSGHIVLSDFACTGDGLVAGLQVVGVLAREQAPASEVCRMFEPLPQVVRNVPFDKVSPLEKDNVKEAIRDAEAALAQGGRILVRKSGTEPVVRIMAEGDDRAKITAVAEHLAGIVAEVA